MMLPRARAWSAVSAVLAAMVVLPLLAVTANLVPFRWEIWTHLASTILPEAIRSTGLLVAGVALLSGALGTSLAWLVAVHDFPGRRAFDWLLLLPLAIPAYVLGFVYLAIFDFTGPLATALRDLAGPSARLPEIRSLPGLIVVMSLVLYPYPYLLARTAFGDLGATAIEAARSLGLSARQAFWRLALPLARPAIAGGVALASMEALADFGTVALFDVRTFTVAIYRVWFGMFDRQAAGQLAILLLVAAVVVLLVERSLRRGARYVQSHGRPARVVLNRLQPRQAWTATAICTAIVGIAFALPVGVLVRWSHLAGWSLGSGSYAPLVGRSLALSFAAASVTIAGALVLAWTRRLHPTRLLRAASFVAGLGYAIPGSVIAVGVLLVVAPLDHSLTGWLERVLGRPMSLVLSGSAAALLFAYLVRFLAVALSSVDSGLEQIAPALDESARGLGANAVRVLRSVHVPLLRGALITGFLLVAVDVLKELPATMLIRPFGWDTLAVEVWQRTTESLWHEAALPALTIAAAGLLPVMALTRLRTDRTSDQAVVAGPAYVTAVERGAPAPGAPLLSIDRVSRRFDRSRTPALDRLSLQIERGEIVALLGPSGCGKTTTLRLIAGFDAPDAGRITIDGTTVTDSGRTLPPERRAVGIVFQEGALFPHLTVGQNTAFGLKHLPRTARAARVSEVLALCELDGFSGRYPHELSGGQQQRAALARALAPGYPVLLLDEPFSSADPALRTTLRTEVRRILKRSGVTTIVVTHDREDAFDLADRIAVMREGRLEQVGTPREVHDSPATAFVARFVADACTVPGRPCPDGVATELGLLPLTGAVPEESSHIDVFLRPDQVLLEPSLGGTGVVVNASFRGDRSLATVRLESGLEIVATAPRAYRVRVNERVAVRVIDAPAYACGSGAAGSAFAAGAAEAGVIG